MLTLRFCGQETLCYRFFEDAETAFGGRAPESISQYIAWQGIKQAINIAIDILPLGVVLIAFANDSGETEISWKR